MGQRLVISVWRNEDSQEKLATIYYHWSAYTMSALEEVRSLIRGIRDNYNDYKNTSDTDIQYHLIKYCENRGGGIMGRDADCELEYIKTVFPNHEFKIDMIGRNKGLIAISNEGMNDLQTLSEGDIDIYLEERRVDNFVTSYITESYEEYFEYRKDIYDEKDDEIIKFEDIPEIYYDPGNFYFDDVDGLINAIYDTNSDVVKYDGVIFDLI